MGSFVSLGGDSDGLGLGFMDISISLFGDVSGNLSFNFGMMGFNNLSFSMFIVFFSFGNNDWVFRFK